MKKSNGFKVAIGTTVHSDTGDFTITGYIDGKERFYVCDYISGISPAYNQKNMDIREQGIDYLFTTK